MKIQRIVGLFIIAMSILTLSIQMSLANVARYIDQTTGKYWSDDYAYRYMSNIYYILFAVVVGIGVYLIVKKDKDL